MTPGWGVAPLGRQLEACVEAAVAAPSVHNSQPWRFRISTDRIDVLWDTRRWLDAIDPLGREALISIGAAVLNLRVAILAAGRIPQTTLLPDPDDEQVLARVALGDHHRPDPTVHALASAIAHRRTNRRPFRDTEVMDQLVAAARAEGATLAIADDAGRQALIGLVRTANEWQRDDPAYAAELAQWTDGQAPRLDGIPARSFGPTDDREVLPLRDFGLGRETSPRRHARFEPAPTMVVLYTAGDTSLDWLRAGQAMERVLLTATCRGVANTPMTAPTELPELRDLLTGSRDSRSAQVILRLGYGDLCPPTPRRPLADVIEVTAPSTPAG
jgi:nitroreductase